MFEKTEMGYRYYVPDEEWRDENFCIYAYEGSEILEHNYIKQFFSDVDGFMAGEYDDEEGVCTETVWIEQSDGSYVLCSKSDKTRLSFSDSGRLDYTE